MKSNQVTNDKPRQINPNITVIYGPRASGKTTLAKGLLTQKPDASLFDEPFFNSPQQVRIIIETLRRLASDGVELIIVLSKEDEIERLRGAGLATLRLIHVTPCNHYSYTTERHRVFSEQGQPTFLMIRDRVRRVLAESDAFRAAFVFNDIPGDDWLKLACLDRLVELKEIREVPQPGAPAQHRVFVAAP